MSRKEFMEQLEKLLMDVQQEERIEALAYYNGYFEDAGVENEEKIIRELESPEKVAKIIKADIGVQGNNQNPKKEQDKTLNGILATELDVDCGTGQMELKNVTAQNVDADCGVGQLTIEMTGQQEEYNYEVDCGIGRVEVGDSSYSGLGSSKQI